MKNKWKLYTTIATLVLMIGLLSYTVYATITGNSGVANRTEFISGDENVFVDISATYSGPALIASDAQTTFTLKITRDNQDSFNENSLTPAVWNIGKTNFVAHEHETIAFTFVIKNLNTETDLNITFSQIAVDYAQRFSSTFYVYDEGQTPTTGISLTAQDANTKTAEADMLTIEKGATKVVKVEFKLLSYASDFEFANNMKVVMASKLNG